MPDQNLLLYGLIIGCEAAFWLVLALALAARYLLKRERMSRGLLYSLPIIDLLLLVFTAVDLKSGTPGTHAHGLATAYVGFTVAFGGIAVRWADQRFAHYFAGGPAPIKPPAAGWPAVRYEFALWARCIVAAVITVALIAALIAFIGNPAATEPLTEWYRFALGCVILWFVFGPAWSMVFFKRGNDAMTSEKAKTFASEWAAAWNARDIDRVLAHFSDDIRFTSPTAQAVVGTPVVQGKAALRAYWSQAMSRIGSLRFTIHRVVWDADARELAIIYLSDIDGRTRSVSENLVFNENGVVVSAEVFHGVAEVQ